VNPTDSESTLHRLIDAAISGRLTELEQLELEERLRSDDSAVRLFLEYCQLETALHFSVRATLAGRRVASVMCLRENVQAPKASQSDRTAESPAERPSRAVSPRMRRRHRRWMGSLSALAVIGVCSWMLIHWAHLPAERQPQPIARLAESHSAEWLGDAGLAVGHRFVEGDSIYLTKGQAQISMSSGAEVVLRAPCLVTLAAAHRLELEEGVLTAQVAEWGHGFTVATPAMQVVDLGTRFAVAASSSGMSETHVLDGQVRVQPLSAAAGNRRSLLLSSGEALRVATNENASTRFAANRELYEAQIDDILPFKPITTFNTGKGLVPGDEDPHWRITAGVQCEHYNGSQFAVVCEADYRYLANEADKSQWISLANPVRPGAPPNSIYTFTTTVDLTGFDLNTVTLAAQVIADNGIHAARVNGQPVSFAPWTLNEPMQKFNRFVVIEINEGLRPGLNTIDFDVFNGIDRYSPEDRNPVSLRVEWHAFGRPQRDLTGDLPRAIPAGTASRAPFLLDVSWIPVQNKGYLSERDSQVPQSVVDVDRQADRSQTFGLRG
jgi:hypothetical protein